ncbi:hypothetical protein [Rhodococcus sp. BS-15]|uniref:hypothetical protein n=1 Tax=Rhodococcus sp. BS-15 TaxID=1304954 RepID=UPI000FFB7B57|nr:hypothetical protein [Rhodococcus sp. BS-15]
MSAAVAELEGLTVAGIEGVRSIPDGAVVEIGGVRGRVVVDRSAPVGDDGGVWVAVLPLDCSGVVVECVTARQITRCGGNRAGAWWVPVVPALQLALAARIDAEKSAQELAEARAALRDVSSRHESAMDKLVADAHEWADDNDLCSRFDEFMEDHNLPTRLKDFDVEVSVRLSTSVTVRVSGARDSDAAEQEVRHSDVEEAMANSGLAGLNLEDFDVVDAELV